MRKFSILLIGLLTWLNTGYANEKVVVSQWLTSPAEALFNPVFSNSPNAEGKTFRPQDLLLFDHHNLREHFPSQGVALAGANGKNLIWDLAQTDENGYVYISKDANPSGLRVAYLATYIWADRWINTTLEIKSPQMLRVWINGEPVATKNTQEKEENTIGKLTKDLKLPRGKHLMIIKTLQPADAALDWKVMANLDIKPAFANTDLGISTDPTNRKNISHVLDGTKITGIQLSADAKYYAISYSRSLPPSDQSETWTDIKRFADKQTVHSFRHARISQLRWLPNSNKISYVNNRNGKSTLFVQDIETGSTQILMEDVDKFGGYSWAPNEQFLIYTIREDGSGTDGNLRQVLGMQDRQPGWRNRSFLYQYDVKSGTQKRLSWGNLSTSLQAISPDSKSIIFSQSYPDYTQRPYSRQNMFRMDLATMTLDTLWMHELRGLSVSFSPDGKYLLATGGPSAFGGAGEQVPEGMIPNNYDTQAYIFDLEQKTVKAFTRHFNPSIADVSWHKADNHIYIQAIEEDYRTLYRYDVKRERFQRLETGVEFATNLSLADNALWALFSGSQINAPAQYFAINLRNLRVQAFENTESYNYRNVAFGPTRNWDYTTSQGVEVKGRMYLPPDFNPEHQYPVIVYYYAGTTPVGRTFGGRYPFNLWAGNGYIVYVLQPSGAIGFGQAFSAAHVNNWGITVADEIIESTQAFLKSHPYADASKVGCAGASYGGFMTMLLMTRTNLFAASVSHAGISSISSYWGEGFWGYAYSAEASAESFPWNNRELYVDQSPLFHADKVVTPMLLITGDSDTNVPPGESIQMYTALKMLDRPVELVLVKGEDHHIANYTKHIQWHNTIMAWWDKHLKGQDQWWDDLFPPKNY